MTDDVPEPDWGPEVGLPPCVGWLFVVFIVLGLSLQFAYVVFHANRNVSSTNAEMQVHEQ